jgi:peptide-methionine (S)-S-oxide reductase
VEIATFGAGCFWKVEDAFLQLKGVEATSVGYMGGHFANPSYLDVLSRITGHAEVAQVEYDPQQITYQQLLDIFWSIHDPTQLNRQGADKGEQYRSVIFYHNPQQEIDARASKQKLQRSGQFDEVQAGFADDRRSTLHREIVTQIQAASSYYLARESEQQYLEKKRRSLK